MIVPFVITGIAAAALVIAFVWIKRTDYGFNMVAPAWASMLSILAVGVLWGAAMLVWGIWAFVNR